MAKAVAYAKSTEEALVPLQLDVKQLEREVCKICNNVKM
jgi:hypothetical protein